MENQPDQKTCETCRHFYRHYVRSGGGNKYSPLSQGHCGYPRLRDKTANTTACQHWSERK